MSVVEAKARLRDLGGSPDALSLLSSPTVRAGAVLLGGILLGRSIGSRNKDHMRESLTRMVVRVGVAAAPLLLEQLLRAGHDRPPERSRA